MYLWFNRSIGTNGLNLMSKTETELLFLKIASIDILYPYLVALHSKFLMSCKETPPYPYKQNVTYITK